MSAAGQTSRSLEIPAVRRIAIHDAAHMPKEYSTTPGDSVQHHARRYQNHLRQEVPAAVSDLSSGPHSSQTSRYSRVTRPLDPDLSNNENRPVELASNNEDDHSLHTEENSAEDAQFEMDI